METRPRGRRVGEADPAGGDTHPDSDFDSKRKVASSLPATIEREGKLLYAA